MYTRRVVNFVHEIYYVGLGKKKIVITRDDQKDEPLYLLERP